MEQFLDNMTGVVCFLDYILITGKSITEHLERKLSDCGLRGCEGKPVCETKNWNAF